MGEIDIPGLVGNLKSFDTWIIILIAAGFGALGGYAHKLTSPPEDKTPWWKLLIVGAVASLAVLFIFTPEDAVRLIALSLAAGYGGKSVLDALEAKVKVALAQAETARVRDESMRVIGLSREATNEGLKLCDVKEEMEKNLVRSTGQSRDAVYKSLSALPPNLQSFAAEPARAVKTKLEKISSELDSSEVQLKRTSL